jgi:hypothetical protein
MPLDWSAYNAYFTVQREQAMLADPAKREVEALCAEILQLDPAVLPSVWGACSPPGVSAQTVVHVPGSIPHRFFPLSQGKAVGLKLFKTERGVGSPPQATVADSHVNLRPRLPGLPSPFVQEVYFAGEHGGRYYLLQEWIEGESLGDVLDRGDVLSVSEARGLICDLFEEILIPLWSVGTIWWDLRDDNYCLQVHGNRRRLVMIDTDSLMAYAKEIVETPGSFTKRDRIKPRAMQRVKTMVENLAWAPFLGQSLPRQEASRLKRTIAAIRSEAEPCFLQPGRLTGGREAFGRMLRRLDDEVWCGVLRKDEDDRETDNLGTDKRSENR